MLKGYTNREIEDEYELPSGTASGIKHKKLYAFWWEKHFEDFDELHTVQQRFSFLAEVVK
jgi:hypothetical protein